MTWQLRSSQWLLVGFLLLCWAGLPAMAQEYTIGPGDVLAVSVWGQGDLSRDYTVDADGFVPFPLLAREGRGHDAEGVAAQLTDLLGKDYLVNPQVIVSVKEYLSQKVQVLGAAEKPGVYHLTGPTTLLEILSRAGGFASTAGKQVLLIRNSGASDGASAVLRLSLEKIQAGDSSENTRVQSQDIVIVSKAQAYSYFVFGEVKKPGAYVLDKETNILEGITVAGGFTEKARRVAPGDPLHSPGPKGDRGGHERHHPPGPGGERRHAPGERCRGGTRKFFLTGKSHLEGFIPK
jgi:polysaccharide export outer membrane protein